MKRIILLFLISGMLSLSTNAQQGGYSTHTITKGETLSVIAKKYNTTVGDIMRLNGMHADSKLSIGQKIKIPKAGKAVPKAAETTAAQTVKTAESPASPDLKPEAGIHVVKKGETLYSISKKYGISIDKLKLWNSLQNDNIEVGESLAIKESAIAAAQVDREQKQKEAASNAGSQEPVVTKSSDETVKTETIPAPDKATTDKKVEAATVVPAVISTDAKAETVSRQLSVAPDGSDNFFSKDFSTSRTAGEIKTAAGAAGVFKTASGWDDKKFYILMNEAPTGSVVKVKSASGNVIYAKVLWPIDDIKANDGLSFRISDAAASALGISDQKFGLIVQYH